MAERMTPQQEAEYRIAELEAIAEKLARALEFYEYEAGHALAHPAVIELNNYMREYRKPRLVAAKPQGAAW